MVKRTRLCAADARKRIIAAAEEKLQTSGIAGLRLTEVASELGVSHQAILHHFGSKKGLVVAVVNHALDHLQNELTSGLAGLHDYATGGRALLERAFKVLVEDGYGRLLGWLALSNQSDFATRDAPLLVLSKLVHALQRTHVPDCDHELSDTTYAMVAITSSILGVSVFGPKLMRDFGLEFTDETKSSYRDWIFAAIIEQLGLPRLSPDDKDPLSQSAEGL